MPTSFTKTNSLANIDKKNAHFSIKSELSEAKKKNKIGIKKQTTIEIKFQKKVSDIPKGIGGKGTINEQI